jgi:hypothetical protein
MALSIMKLCYYAECHCAECQDLFIGMLNVIMRSVIRLNVVMLSVVAPHEPPYDHLTIKKNSRGALTDKS